VITTRNRHALSALSLLASSVACFQIANAQEFGGIDGIWQGTLKVVATSNPEASADFEKFPCRLEIERGAVRVYFRSKEVKPDLFKIETHKTNAVIWATDSGQDSDGTWVETWAVAITEKDRGNVIVNVSWLVNNIDISATTALGRISASAVGEFQRVSH
jgi:hypothetical protein